MLDHAGDFLDIDLDALDSEWTTPPYTETPTPTTKRRAGKQRDPDWKPNTKGEPVDRTSAKYLAEKAAAQLGIPPLATLAWCQVQLLDRGPSLRPGHTQFALKLECSDAKPEHCTRQGLIAMKRERWVNLSTMTNFKTNLRKKKKVIDDEGRVPARWLLDQAVKLDAREGAPRCRAGFVSCRFEGTRIYNGQYGMLYWRSDDAGNWHPMVIFTHLWRSDFEHFEVDLREPSAVNRDGTPRKPSGYILIGTWYSEALQQRITAGREIKAMRAADMARTGRA